MIICLAVTVHCVNGWTFGRERERQRENENVERERKKNNRKTENSDVVRLVDKVCVKYYY